MFKKLEKFMKLPFWKNPPLRKKDFGGDICIFGITMPFFRKK